VKYLLLFIWIELICVFAFSCSGPRERRGDWMEHLNYRQFTSEAPMVHWDRYNYYSLEELKEMWNEGYNKAIEDIPAAAERMLQQNKRIEKNEDIH